MMRAWEFPVRNHEEAGRLLRTLGKHRYVKEVDHRIHILVDAALSEVLPFSSHHEAFTKQRESAPDLDLLSRDPRLFRSASADEVAQALSIFWSPGGGDARSKLRELYEMWGFAAPTAPAFAADPNDPPHPELILLDWVLYAVDALDAERHAGVLSNLEESTESYHPSEPIYQEGPTLALHELCEGCAEGALRGDFLIWSDGPYAYADYVFRGASRAAKLDGQPIGIEELG